MHTIRFLRLRAIYYIFISIFDFTLRFSRPLDLRSMPVQWHKYS